MSFQQFLDRCGFETEKVQDRAGASWDGLQGGAGQKCTGVGQVSARFLKFMQVRDGTGLKFAGWERTKNFNPRRTLVHVPQVGNPWSNMLQFYKISISKCGHREPTKKHLRFLSLDLRQNTQNCYHGHQSYSI